ncbi:glycoside hydrolase family 3 N-terminal domain-containing protein [Microlunatus speluncae]|uniref:glycoside hydrolase family 3 N-terminal domain-containing protein n=1 Tax=Microlunatus speluncae TaxID=2594267 RepID=UPI00126619B5|nr:glycoside hydrolase family 3 N-terminal domain-containing protein [Microlunatus speluncae]
MTRIAGRGPASVFAALTALALLAGCGNAPPVSSPTPTSASSPPDSPIPESPTPSGTPTPTAATCASVVAGLNREERIGQLLMVAIDSSGLSSSTADTLAEVRAGSVLLLGNTDSGRRAIKAVTDDARAAIKTPSGIGVLLAADQEGGQVQRLSGSGFDDMPSAEEQAELSDSELRGDAENWGEQLKKAGIDANLAPVADVVPKSLEDVNEPIAGLDRGYGSDPEKVGQKVAAFVEGMDKAGIATSLKHFPGLGKVRGNTDFTDRVTDSTTDEDDPGFAAFRAGIDAGADMIMAANAYYSKIDPDHQAVFSKKIITGLIREGLNFDGVVISDDLAAKGVSDLSPEKRATSFISAGGDLMIIGAADDAEDMAEALEDKAESDKSFDARITESATRVVALKSRHGLASCSP